MLPRDTTIAALNTFQPHLLVGPPSLLGFLADARGSGELQIAPQRLIAVAEVLEPQDHERIAGTFDAPVHQIYQCTEGLLAISCPAGVLHIQEDLVAIQGESLPGGGARVTPIVIDLWHTTQPIIRYQLNDVLQLDPAPCRCGSELRVIRTIEGRCDDLCVFLTPQGDEVPCYPDTIRRMVLLAEVGIAGYAAEQARPGHLRIYLAPMPGVAFAQAEQAVYASVITILAQYGCRPPEVEIIEGLPLLAPGAKQQRVRRLHPQTV